MPVAAKRAMVVPRVIRRQQRQQIEPVETCCDIGQPAVLAEQTMWKVHRMQDAASDPIESQSQRPIRSRIAFPVRKQTAAVATRPHRRSIDVTQQTTDLAR